MVKLTLKAARVNACLTQEAAAEKIGVSVQTVRNWESGLTVPRGDMVMKIVDAYEIPLDNINFLPSGSEKPNHLPDQEVS